MWGSAWMWWGGWETLDLYVLFSGTTPEFRCASKSGVSLGLAGDNGERQLLRTRKRWSCIGGMGKVDKRLRSFWKDGLIVGKLVIHLTLFQRNRCFAQAHSQIWGKNSVMMMRLSEMGERNNQQVLQTNDLVMKNETKTKRLRGGQTNEFILHPLLLHSTIRNLDKLIISYPVWFPLTKYIAQMGKNMVTKKQLIGKPKKKRKIIQDNHPFGKPPHNLVFTPVSSKNVRI